MSDIKTNILIVFYSMYGHTFRLVEAVAEGAKEIKNTNVSLLHHGMIIVGVPYSEKRLMNMSKITGGSPYGASTISGPNNTRMLSENEIEIAKY